MNTKPKLTWYRISNTTSCFSLFLSLSFGRLLCHFCCLHRNCWRQSKDERTRNVKEKIQVDKIIGTLAYSWFLVHITLHFMFKTARGWLKHATLWCALLVDIVVQRKQTDDPIRMPLAVDCQLLEFTRQELFCVFVFSESLLFCYLRRCYSVTILL